MKTKPKSSGNWLDKLAVYLSRRFPISEKKAEKIRRGIVRYGEFLYRRKNSKWKWVSRWHNNIINSTENGPEAVQYMHEEYLKLNSKK